MNTYLTTVQRRPGGVIDQYAFIEAENLEQAQHEARGLKYASTRLYRDVAGVNAVAAEAQQIAIRDGASFLGIFTADAVGKIEIVMSTSHGAPNLDTLRELLTRHGYTIHRLEKK